MKRENGKSRKRKLAVMPADVKKQLTEWENNYKTENGVKPNINAIQTHASEKIKRNVNA